MEDEEGYTVLNLRPKGRGSVVPSSDRIQGLPQAPPWHRLAQWVAWVVIITLLALVVVLGIWVSHLVSEKGQTPAAPGSDGAGSRDPSTAECSTCLECFRSQLCPPAPPGPAGGSRCKLCPTDWRLDGNKCYWVSRENKIWSESRANCSARGSQLLVIRDQEELEFIKDLTQSTSLFWIGLSIPSLEKAWTWVDGSQLDQTQFPVSGPAEENSCGVVKGNQIHSDTCNSAFQSICQQDAIPL
ncbi:killer cell lectin-like receptor subfamily F member 1 [Pangshura tecta]